MNRICSWVSIAFLACGCLQANAQPASVMTIVASGETHAMLYPCDCPGNPGGGMAKRATILSQLKKSEKILLVDGGGFSGGGMYDTYTEGRLQDSIRTIAVLQAMGMLTYDAATVGDDDLQYGALWLNQVAKKYGVTLVSANIRMKNGKKPFPPYVIVTINGVSVGITGITTDERLFDIDQNIDIDKPVPALKKVWKELSAKSSIQVIVSHLGEEQTRHVADSFPHGVIFVNAHRKNDSRPVSFQKNVPILQFGFQGKRASSVQYDVSQKAVIQGSDTWIAVTNDIADDPAMLSLLKSTLEKSQLKQQVYDLYIMGLCPYGLDALKEFSRFVQRFPASTWNIWFIGQVEKDSVCTSLHGPEEILGEKAWLAVKSLYPTRWTEFLIKTASLNGNYRDVISSMKLDTGKISRWIKEKGTEELSLHYQRSMRLGIDASPTLLINNTPFEQTPTFWRLAKLECGDSSEEKVCDSLPKCLDDADCRKPGMVGQCVSIDSMPHCEFHEAVKFSLLIVSEDSTGPKILSARKTTSQLFPGASIKIIPYDSNDGKRLIGLMKPVSLPLYLFDKKITKDFNFEKVKAGLIEQGGYFTFKPGIMRPTYYYQRKEIVHSRILFIDPLFPKLEDVLNLALPDTGLIILPILYGDPSETRNGSEEQVRMEEAQRWLILNQKYTKSYRKYLAEYAKHQGSSYWFAALSKQEIGLDAFYADVQKDTRSLGSHWDILQELDVKEPVVLLIDNREIIPARSEQELKQIKERLNSK